MRYRTRLWIALIASLALPACSSSATEDYSIIFGTVKDTSNAVLGTVKVTADGQTVQTNDQGWFSISNIAITERLLITFEKQGYVMTAQVTKTKRGESKFITAVMAPLTASQTLDAAAGGTVTFPSGAVIVFPASSLVSPSGSPFTGTANVAVTLFDPTTPAGQAAFPGTFEGVGKDGKVIPIASFGYVDITVTDASGALLQLASGKAATISIPIPAAILSVAPATLPFWYFNPSDGQWHEESTGTKAGSVYTGAIPHFSIWNSDVGYDRAYITGRVIDCVTGLPVVCAEVKARGISPRSCWTSGETCTSDDGRFTIPVDANSVFDIFASKNGTDSDHQQLTAPGTEQTRDIGTICIGTPKMKIILTWSTDPQDLDAHLTIPPAPGSTTRDHVYFSNKVASDSSVTLDTDDTSSYGPEIITAYFLHDGVYRYSVHDFNGEGTISTSKASVNMMIDGVGIYSQTPPAGATGVKDAWAVWDIVVSHGEVTSVQVLNTIQHEVSSSDTAAFSPGAPASNP